MHIYQLVMTGFEIGVIFTHYWPHLASVEIDSHALLMVCKLYKKDQLKRKRNSPAGSGMVGGEEELAALRGVSICIHRFFF